MLLNSLPDDIKPKIFMAKTMMYIGFREGSIWRWQSFMSEHGCKKFIIVEAWKGNVDFLLNDDTSKESTTVIHADIMTMHSKEIKLLDVDLIYWEDGPEHVTDEQLKVITPVLKKAVNKAIVYEGPYGTYPQHKEDNPFEEHQCTLMPALFNDLGLECTTFSPPGMEGRIIGWYTH